MGKKTVVIGASTNPDRYAFMAVKKLEAYKHPVEAVGQREGDIGDIKIKTGQPPIEEVDTVTLYVGPANQPPLYDYIIGLHPKRIIFNPGTENQELEKMARENNIDTLHACTLVMLSTGQY